MSLRDALNYPFKHRNLARIVPIAIMYSIVAFLFQYFALAENTFLTFLAALGLLFFSVALNGFFIRVIRTVRHDNEVMPEFNQMREDFKPGCVSLLGVVFHAMFVVLFLIVVSVLSLDFLLLLLLPMIPALVLVYTMGLTRYAFEFRANALFEFSTNLSLVRENLGEMGGLLWRFMAVGLLSYGVSVMINVVISSMIPGNVMMFQMPDMGTWLVIAMANIISYTIGVIFNLSQYHLMARLGQQIDLGGRKSKAKNDFAMDGGRQY